MFCQNEARELQVIFILHKVVIRHPIITFKTFFVLDKIRIILLRHSQKLYEL